jgi:phospholipid/cholesterol/gamma-HCH transport system substrate-binding protein
MNVTRRMKIQLVIFVAIGLVASAVLLLGYVKAPSAWFGVGNYTVTVQLPRSGSLYKGGNVTYRGTEVGRIQDVHLTDTGVEAVLSMKESIPIPSDVEAEVHSVSAFGEQYVALQPRNGSSPPLKNGAVIPVGRTTLPPEVGPLLDAANRGLQAVPQGDLKTAIDESFTAVGGLGPELSRIVKGSTQLSIDAHDNLDALTNQIDGIAPLLNTQSDTSGAIQSWASHLAAITHQLSANDDAVAGLITQGGPAADRARELIDRLQPSLPLLLANLVSINDVTITYQPNIEQLLVLLPEGVAELQAGVLANQDNPNQQAKGAFLDFKLNLNLPPPCTTGFLPAQQMRVPTFEDYPDRPAGDLYCRIPQDSPVTAVRGARNYPCETRPGKRAPTVEMCESDEQYMPLNDGENWKGDPNATLSGQDVPQLAPGSPAQQAPPPGPAPYAAPPIAVTKYDPTTGSYLAPDGHVYTQSNLAHDPKDQTWQSMLIPPTTN